MRRLTALSFSLARVVGLPRPTLTTAACALGLAASLAGCSGSNDHPESSLDAGAAATGGTKDPHSGGAGGSSAGTGGKAGATGGNAGTGTDAGRTDASPATPGQGTVGQSSFVSAPPGGTSSWSSGRGNMSGDTATSAGLGAAAPASEAKGSNGATTSTRTVEETDLYRYDSATQRLYYLNSYRGLMVFDVSNIDDPKLLGRAPIFGDPVEMVVRNGIVSVIIGDWYGTGADGAPFHGSVVRGYNATDPAHIAQIGEATVGGWVRDSRVVSDPNAADGVLYMVSEDYGWRYGWNTETGAAVSGSSTPGVLITSVRFAPTGIEKIEEKRFDSNSNCYWYSGGIFNVTNESIMLAHSHAEGPVEGGTCQAPTRSDLVYLDITDPNGAIRQRGTLTVDGVAQGWGADNGRWNLDFADKVHAHIIGCNSGRGYCGNSNDSYLLTTADFTSPDAPVLASQLAISSPGWSVTARFDANRMYLSPADNYYDVSSTETPRTPVRIYDLANPSAPAFAGQAEIPNSVWLFMPSGQQIFALGQLYQRSSSGTYYASGSKVSLSYLDVTQAASPSVIGTASFGDGWAWTPASGTFKAFTKDDTQGLVVLPFSSWNSTGQEYVNGLQLIEFTAPKDGSAGAIAASGTARTKGWVERGILVKNRLVSLSDLSLAIIDYSNHASPATIKEITLARNVIDATPQSTTLAELSSDWWGYDNSKTVLRSRPISDPEENQIDSNVPEVTIPGQYAKAFHSADDKLAYVVTSEQVTVPCPYASTSTCTGWTQRVQVVDESGTAPVKRGAVELPGSSYWYYYWDDWGWYGCWYYDWYNGSNVVQVGDHILAFRRWGYNSANAYDDPSDSLYIVDVSNPDQPTLASTTITRDKTAWWGNMRAVGSTLYTTHYEWWHPTVDTNPDDAGVTAVDAGTEAGLGEPEKTVNPNATYARYYLDRIDLTDPTHPKIGSKINVPGILVGAKDSDPSILYTIDYYWDAKGAHDQLAAVQIKEDKAYLLSTVSLDGWVGRVITENDRAYMTVQSSGYDADAGTSWSKVQLHQIDMSDPAHPTDLAAVAHGGWGWLLDVAGDRAFVSSGWGTGGFDIYKLSNGAPQFDRFVRTRGWSASSLKRQGNTAYLSTGYWGVQTISLE